MSHKTDSAPVTRMRPLSPVSSSSTATSYIAISSTRSETTCDTLFTTTRESTSPTRRLPRKTLPITLVPRGASSEISWTQNSTSSTATRPHCSIPQAKSRSEQQFGSAFRLSECLRAPRGGCKHSTGPQTLERKTASADCPVSTLRRTQWPSRVVRPTRRCRPRAAASSPRSTRASGSRPERTSSAPAWASAGEIWMP